MPITYSATPYNFIVVANDDVANPTFVATTLAALNTLNSQPIGLALLNAISNGIVAADAVNNFKVKIMRPAIRVTEDGRQGVIVGQPGMEGGSRAVAFNELDGRFGGGGTKAGCYWNPNIWNTPRGFRPAFIGLAHELIHCYHYVNALAKASYDDEEKFTVGLDPYSTAAITENRVRLDFNIPVRHEY